MPATVGYVSMFSHVHANVDDVGGGCLLAVASIRLKHFVQWMRWYIVIECTHCTSYFIYATAIISRLPSWL